VGKNKKSSNYLIQGTILAAASIIVRIIGLVYRIPLTKIIGNAGNGIYSVAYEIYGIILMISSISIPLAVSKMVSTKVAMGQRKNAFKIFKGALVFAMISGGIAAIFTFFGAGWLSNIMSSPSSMFALKVLAPTLFVSAVLGAVRGYFQGLGTMVPTAMSQIIEQIVNAVVSVAAAYFFFQIGYKKAGDDTNSLLAPAYGAAGGTLGTGVGTIAALLFLLFVFYLYWNVLRKQMRRDTTRGMDTYKEIYYIMFMTILPVVLSTVVYNISNVVDQGIFNKAMSAQGFAEKQYQALWGMYSGKFRVLMNVPLSIASCLTPSMIPSLTQAMLTNNTKEAAAKVHMSFRYTMVLTIPCTVGFIVLSSPIIRLIFQDSDKEPARIMMLGSVMIIFYAISTLGNGILQGIDRMRVPVINALIALGLHLVLLFVLLYTFKLNIYAVIIANIFFAVIMCILNQRAISKYLGYRQELIKTYIIPSISSVIMGIAAFFVHKIITLIIGDGLLSNGIGTLLAIIIAAAIYVVCLIKLKGISKREIYGLPKGALLVSIGEKLRLL
jgi:stage V sporulation protein B